MKNEIPNVVIITNCIYCSRTHVYKTVFEQFPVFGSSGIHDKEVLEEVVGICPSKEELFKVKVRIPIKDGFEIENLSFDGTLEIDEDTIREILDENQVAQKFNILQIINGN